MIRYAIPKPEPLLVEHEAFRDAVSDTESERDDPRGRGTVEVAEALLRAAASAETQTIG